MVQGRAVTGPDVYNGACRHGRLPGGGGLDADRGRQGAILPRRYAEPASRTQRDTARLPANPGDVAHGNDARSASAATGQGLALMKGQSTVPAGTTHRWS